VATLRFANALPLFMDKLFSGYMSPQIFLHQKGYIYVTASIKEIRDAVDQLHVQGSSRNNERRFLKRGVPKPETASQPFVALKPFVPQPGLFPDVISLNASPS